ncbi:MAG TPA: hypothetical protein VH595_04990 [Verrucomicrobiae bacterium]|jgi:hypothetical protein|nr:hypothetical protein [Verrucomicrobiae bacterium]
MPSNSREPRWHGEHEPDTNPREFIINSDEYERIPFGEGQDDPDSPNCGECGAAQGSIHKLGCGAEPCPRCGAPAITCDCEYEGD